MLSELSPKRIGWQPYVYLFYLGFLFVQPVLDPDFGLNQWLFTLASIAVFLPLYFSSFLYKGANLPVAAMAFLGLFTSIGIAGFYNSGASAYFIYAAAAAAYTFKPRGVFVFLGFLALLIGFGLFTSTLPIQARLYIYLPSLIFSCFVAVVNIFEAEHERSRAKLERANEEIEHLATIAERERIARDLHDLLGHTLSVITLKSELAAKLIDKDITKARTEMQEVERISRETLAEVRSAVSGYRQKGFMAEVASAKLALESAGVTFAFKGDTSVLSALQESTLSLVLREAVTNIIRHAGASRCSVQLVETHNDLEFDISDNGIGLKAERGHGLSGIQERVTLLGGRFELSSFQGTRLKIVLPKELARQTRPIPKNLTGKPETL